MRLHRSGAEPALQVPDEVYRSLDREAVAVVQAFAARPTLALYEAEISARSLLPVSAVRRGIDYLLQTGGLMRTSNERGYSKYQLAK